MKFKSPYEFYAHILSETDYYNPDEGLYVFRYNQAGAICCYYGITPAAADAISKEAAEINEYWGAVLGSGGYIYDDPSEFLEEMYSKEGWIDTKDWVTEKPFEDYLCLLSTDEVGKYFSDNESRKISCWWWLRSPGNYVSLAANVHADGSLLEYGYDVDSERGVRPALHLKSFFDLKIGETIRFGANVWRVIHIKSDQTATLISDKAVWFHRFDSECNKYESSEVRRWLNTELVNDLFTEEELKQIVPFNWKEETV